MNYHNPLYNLRITTPRLVLRVPHEIDIDKLGKIAAQGIQKPGEPHFQDEGLYGKKAEEISKGLKEFIQKHISEWNKEDWQLPFAIYYEGNPIGLITIYSKQFHVTRGFGASYWLGLPYQGKGLGTEALQGVLTLGFDKLNAREAYCGAWSDNMASLRVMEKLGFVFNGEYWMNRNGLAVKDKRMRLSKENWQSSEGITVEGLEQYLELF